MLLESIRDELSRLAEAGLLRRLRSVEQRHDLEVKTGGQTLVNFSSNDYLGLAQDPELSSAMIDGVKKFGVGSGASRLVCGNLAPHDELESAIAVFKGTEAALAFGSGYAVALGTLPALCGKDDFIILDKLCHASLIDAAKLSGATLRVFPHNDLDRLAHLLRTARTKSNDARILVVTESIFSMDGDAAPLREIVGLCELQDAWLLVDEAHAVGLLGPQGRGMVAELGLEKRVPLQMGTLSKAVGVSGGYIAAARPVIDLLINKARSLIYSTAPPPAIAFAAAHALTIVQSARGDILRKQLRANLAVTKALKVTSAAAILPLIIGEESAAVQMATALLERGYLIPAIRYPTVARGAARLRLTLSAAHERGQVESLVTCLLDLMPQLRREGEAAL